VLMKSMDYLLELLNKPYDNDFLGLYNFLWDRMRAIRMDLRMQHIFNLEAISMLEQMVPFYVQTLIRNYVPNFGSILVRTTTMQLLST
jgi:nuclear mRNA export protein SAC3